MSINLHSRQTVELQVALECHQVEHTHVCNLSIFMVPRRRHSHAVRRKFPLPGSQLLLGATTARGAPNKNHIYVFREM